MTTNVGTRARGALVGLGIALVALGAACTSALPPGDYPGGTYDVDITLESQTIEYSAGGCTASLVTDPIILAGATVTVPPFTVTGSGSITVSPVEVNVPAGNAIAGVTTLDCGGEPLGPIGFEIIYESTVHATEGTVDQATRELTLTDATMALTNATVSIAGLPGFPLPDPTVTLPTITLNY